MAETGAVDAGALGFTERGGRVLGWLSCRGRVVGQRLRCRGWLGACGHVIECLEIRKVSRARCAGTQQGMNTVSHFFASARFVWAAGFGALEKEGSSESAHSLIENSAVGTCGALELPERLPEDRCTGYLP